MTELYTKGYSKTNIGINLLQLRSSSKCVWISLPLHAECGVDVMALVLKRSKMNTSLSEQMRKSKYWCQKLLLRVPQMMEKMWHENKIFSCRFCTHGYAYGLYIDSTRSSLKWKNGYIR